MKDKLRKYRASIEAAERWLDEIKTEIEPVYDRWRALDGGGEDYFPPSIESISEYGGKVTFSGVSYRRGCSNGHRCPLPSELFYGSPAEREVIFTRMEDANRAKQLAAQTALENAEKQQLAALKSKYGE